MPARTFGLIEHVNTETGYFPAHLAEATEREVWEAIDRLDCSDYAGIMVWTAPVRGTASHSRGAHRTITPATSIVSSFWDQLRPDRPLLGVVGCERLGYSVEYLLDRGTYRLVPNPDAQGSVDMVTGNQEVDIAVRDLCDRGLMKAAVEGILADGFLPAGLPWVKGR